MAMSDPSLEQAKRIITAEIERAGCRMRRIVLFGSRARGDPQPTSDWDFYVIVDRDLSFSEREELASAICWRLAQQEIFADVFIRSERLAAERQHDPGYLTYYALREGTDL